MPNPPDGFKWELAQPPIDVGFSFPRYKRLVGPWIELTRDPEDNTVSIDAYNWELEVNLTPEQIKKHKRY